MKSTLAIFLQPIISLFIYLYLNFLKSERVTNRKASSLQTEEIGCKCQTFFKISSLSSRRKHTLHGNFFLMLLMKLCICFGICLSSKWFHLRLTFFLFSSLGLIIAQQTSVHISWFMAGGWHISCHPISKMHIVGEGPGEIPSAFGCLCYLINSFLADKNHSIVLAWRILGTEEPSGLPSMGSHRVRHDWSDLPAAADIKQLC